MANTFVIKCIESNLVIEYGILGTHLREQRRVNEQLWFWRGDQLINQGRKFPLCIDGEYKWTFVNGILVGRTKRCSLCVVRKKETVLPKNGARLHIETDEIDNVQFWEKNEINNTFFGNSKHKFLLPSFSSNSELIFLQTRFGSNESHENNLQQDAVRLEYRSLLLPLWFEPLDYSQCEIFNRSIVVVKDKHIKVMKTIGVYENFNIEYFEHDGEKYLQGILSTVKNQLFIVGGRYTNPSVRTQKFPSSSRSWLPRSTQILTSDMSWKNGPELPSPFIMPILHSVGDNIIVLGGFIWS